MHHPNYMDGVQGRIELTVELVPAAEAAANPVGLGRDEPNRDPMLPEPKRPEKSFNPLRADKWVKVRTLPNQEQKPTQNRRPKNLRSGG